jgi:diguanylate cyclase (GGDEF)-like protein
VQVSQSLNYILGSWLVFLLIYADYARKYNTDTYQRSLFFKILICAFIPLNCDLIYFIFEGSLGKRFTILFYILDNIYYVFQILSYYYIFIFIDFLAFRSSDRVKKLTLVAWIVTAAHIILLIINFKTHFYFYVDEESNLFFRGPFYPIRVIIAYSPVALVIIDIALSAKVFKKNQVVVLFFFVLLICLGSNIDLVFGTSYLIWPCFAAAMLYAYFFIVHTDTTIDSLTGIGNRFAFNEFIDKLAKQSAKESYSIAMIDLDHFKKINDTLGHAEGDNALRDMAAIIKGCIRHSDFAARYGGDEFVIAVPAAYDIKRLMERIQQAMDVQNEKHSRPYNLEMSYGYDVYTTGADKPINEFINRIDTLMYQQKEGRRQQLGLRKAR